mmetsp:Transcript_28186/g.86136  ORF Transcript_28186/g.86136 Transcript_28186/m.86136 type:complete len:116 (+) Transcript_28186:143-490(+)|eukprot:scaffold232520_cov31-Tisochrysis_lutea.AAC.2
MAPAVASSSGWEPECKPNDWHSTVHHAWQVRKVGPPPKGKRWNRVERRWVPREQPKSKEELAAEDHERRVRSRLYRIHAACHRRATDADSTTLLPDLMRHSQRSPWGMSVLSSKL